MSRRSRKELKKECLRRLRALEILWDEFVPADSLARSVDPGPIVRTEADIESGSLPPGSILCGINKAIGYIVEGTSDLTADDLRGVDAKLRDAGHETLSQMRSEHWKKVQQIMTQRRIDDEADYRIVMAKLNDVSTGRLTDDQRKLLGELVVEFEIRSIGASD